MSENVTTAEIALEALTILKRIESGEILPGLFVYMADGEVCLMSFHMSEEQMIAQLSCTLFDVQMNRAKRRA